MITNEYHLISKNETEFVDPLTEMGQISLDSQRVNNLKVVFSTLRLDINNQVVVAKRVATLAFQKNINYKSMEELFLAVNLPINELINVYRDYENNMAIFCIADMITNPKKSIGLTKQQLNLIENKINSILLTANMSSYPTAELSNKSECVLIPSDGRVYKCTYRDEEKTQLSNKDVILNVCPIKVTCHINKNDPFDRKYDWLFIKASDKEELRMNTVDIKTTTNKLNDSGYSMAERETKNTLNQCLTALNEYSVDHEECYIEKVTIVPRGFAFDEKRNKIIVENYQLIKSTKEDIKKALRLINEYIEDMTTEDEKLFCVTNFKWGLYAPFIYASKQMVKGVFDVESPYLQGVGRTGKTTGHGHMVLAMWYDNINDGLMAGTVIETFPQFSYAIERDTLPLVFDEGGANFENEYDGIWLDRLKSALNSINWRHTRDKDGHIFESRNPFMITSNGQIHDPQNAVTRRLFIEQFTYNEDKTPEMEEYFLKKYGTGTDHNRLFELKHISHTFAKYVIEHPQVLGSDYDWKDVVNNFLYNLYHHYGVKPHRKIFEWVDVQEIGITNEKSREVDRLKEGIKKRIIETKRYVAKSDSNPHSYMKNVIDNMSGINYVSRGEVERIQITKSFLTSLYKSRDVGKNYTLKDASIQLKDVGFELKRNSESRFIACSVDKFIDWLYPEEVMLS